MIHQNSQAAYDEIRGQLSGRRLEVFEYLESHRYPLTDRQIMRGMSKTDMNAVRPRITELVKLGIVEECESIKCQVTKKRVRTVRVTKDNPKQGLLSL